MDLENNEKYSSGIYDIKEKKYYPKVFKNTSTIEFTNNPNIFIYLVSDEKNRPYKILQHTVGSDKDDIVLFEEKQEHIFLETNPTKDNNYLVINSLTKDDSEIFLINLSLNENDHLQTQIQSLLKRQKDVKYFIEHFNVIIIE